jgi:hypothetical protein
LLWQSVYKTAAQEGVNMAGIGIANKNKISDIFEKAKDSLCNSFTTYRKANIRKFNRPNIAA